MIEKTYTQCKFQQKLFEGKTSFSQGEREVVAWIESWAAKKGNSVQLLDLDGTFWEVVEVYSVMRAEELRERSRDYKERQGSLKGGGIDER